MNTQPTLEQRISDALQPDAAITSVDIAALIDEAEAGIVEAEKEATVDRTFALDPKAARQAIEDAAFAAESITHVAVEIAGALSGRHDREKAKACWRNMR